MRTARTRAPLALTLTVTLQGRPAAMSTLKSIAIAP
jgi:hypothetical protein